MSEMSEESKEEIYFITPWGCLSSVLDDYNIDTSHITPKMGEHMVEDFMDAMVKSGHVVKKEEDQA